MLYKLKKLDYMNVMSYRVICLLIYLRKGYETIVADMLSGWCEITYVLHNGQRRSRRQRSTIGVTTRVTKRVQQA